MLVRSATDPMGLRVSGSGDSIVPAGATNGRYSFYPCHLAPDLFRFSIEIHVARNRCIC